MNAITIEQLYQQYLKPISVAKKLQLMALMLQELAKYFEKVEGIGANKEREIEVQIDWHMLSKPTAEALISELYAADSITFKQAQRMLNHTDWQETVEVLKQHGCQLYYDRDDFENDLQTLAHSSL
jgi:predicted HTH domain antitoxin